MDSFTRGRGRARRPSRRLTVLALAAAALLVMSMASLAAARPAPPPAPAQAPTRAATVPPPALAGDILLSVQSRPDELPVVAFNETAEEYLVVWVSGTYLTVQRMDARGVPVGEASEIVRVTDWASRPAVAFSPRAKRYLVAWSDTGQRDDDIFGRLLAADGQPASDLLVLSEATGDQEEPAVAVGASGFLVAWSGDAGDDSQDITGRLVGDDGSLGSQSLPIGVSGDAPYGGPSAGYDAVSGHYVVAYEVDEGSHAQIRARLFDGTTGAPQGAEVPIASQTHAVKPRVAVGRAGSASVALIVWDDQREGQPEVYARALTLGSPPRLGKSDLALGAWPDSERQAAVAALPGGAFLVVWEVDGEQSATQDDLVGRVVQAPDLSAGEPFTVSRAPGNQVFADVAVRAAPVEALVVWEDRRTEDSHEILSQRLGPDGEPLATEQTVSAAPGEQTAPVAAYNRDDDQYLAVWQDRRGAATALMAQRLAATGLALEARWTLDDDGHENVEPDVAYSPQCRCYLVVWADSTAMRLETARIPPGGGFIQRDEVDAAGGGRRPRVVYDEPNHHFLVLWHAHGDLYAARLDWNSAVPQAPAETVFAGTGIQDQAAVAVDSTRHQYLAVWRGGTSGAEDIYGRLLDALGRPLGEAIALAGGGADPVPMSAPSVAYDPGAGGYLLAYVAGVTAKDGDIRSRFVTAQGTPFGPETAVRDQPTGADQSAPQVTFELGTGRYHVLWAELGAGSGGGGTGVDLFGRWMAADGRAASSALPFVRSPGDQQLPRVAPDAEHGRVLVVWEDTRRSKAADIYGRVGELDTLPPTAHLAVNPSAGPPGTVFNLDARASRDNVTPAGALTVRWDWTSDGAFDTPWTTTKVVTRTVRAAGTYTVTVEVRDAVGLSAAASRMLKVVAGTVNRVPTAGLTVAPDTGPAGTVFAFDASSSSDPETPVADLEVRWDWEADGAYDTPWARDKVVQRSLTVAGTQRVRVEVRDGGGVTASAGATVRVTAGPTARLEVSPGSATLRAGEHVRFFAATWDRFENPSSNAGVRWLVLQPGLGAIDARGVFTAGTRAGTFADVVRAADGAVGDSASVTIVVPRVAVYLPWAVGRR